MSDKPTEQPTVEPQENPVDPTPTQPTIEELTAKLDALTKSNEQQKTEIAGLNKSYANKNNEYAEYRKSKETEEEAKQREAEERKQSRLEKERSLTDRETQIMQRESRISMIDKAIELGVDKAVIDRYGFSKPEQLEAYKEDVSTRAVQVAKESNEKVVQTLSGLPPQHNNNNEGNSEPNWINRAFK